MSRMIGDIGFDAEIGPLFTEGDRNCMISRFDLAEWDDVRRNHKTINDWVQSGRMPPGGWPADKREMLRRWVTDGCPKLSGSQYLQYFVDMDAETEYWSLYGNDRSTMDAAIKVMSGYSLWTELAVETGSNREAAIKERMRGLLDDSDFVLALQVIDNLFERLLDKHFALSDWSAYLDAMEKFGRDALPADQDRYNRTPNNSPLKGHALHHTMDGQTMWFQWASYLEYSWLLSPHGDNDFRAALLAGVAIGCPMDYRFRGRSTTLPDFADVSDGLAERRIRSRAADALANHAEGVAYVRELFVATL